MNNLKGKELDEFFRRNLTGNEPQFNEAHWLALEKRLKKDKRRRVIWMFTSVGVAAMLLLALSLFLKVNNESFIPTEESKVAKNDKLPLDTDTGTTAGNAEEKLDVQKEVTSEGFDFKPNTRETVAKSFLQPLPQKKEQRYPGIIPADSTSSPSFVDDLPLAQSKPIETEEEINTPPLLAINSAAGVENISTETSLSKDTQVKKEKVKAKSDFTPTLSLSVFGGPDINGVNNLKSPGNGVSGGLVVTYALHPKWSVAIGAAYAKKLYNTDYSSYKPSGSYQFPSPPSQIDADCRVLDIPINVNYTPWSKKGNAIQLTAGLSSYFMLKEDYYFEYADPYYKGPAQYEIENENKHFLGVIGLGVGYQRNFNKNISVGIAPYIKLPITDIGYGNVRLQSAGVNTSISFKLPSFKSSKK